ncbi:MAG: NAD-dependent epimerase/dehydratase family protein, partial [Gluconacetobacter diazotrophicus]|nr:NAD-dependent epimerase/dehydratase family protein [Gluconacetobacter diazotrophicus]
MKVAITGASGFVGTHLIRRLRVRGHKAVALVRDGGGRPAGSVATRPFPKEGPPDLRGLDAVVNLAGESILGWWTKSKKQRIVESRVDTTQRLVAGIKALPPGKGPRVLVSASAVGYYGDAAEAVLDEAKPAGSGFLAEVAREWEEAAQTAESAGVRVARVRIGVVLGKDGGAFPAQRK